MKLFVFETCPFCLRVQIFAGLKGVNLEIIPLEPGVIPGELAGRVDRFSVPILLDGKRVLNDSAMILQHLDQRGTALLADSQCSSGYEAWSAKIRKPLNVLCYPRMLALRPGELTSDAARTWFAQIIPERIGMSFADALGRTDEFWAQISAHLPEALQFLEGALRHDTVAALADLHSLTMVAEHELPESLKSAFTTLINRAQIRAFPAVTRDGLLTQEVSG